MITQLPTTNFTENFEPEFKQAIAFSDTVGAMNSIAYQPFIDAYKARKKHGYKVDQNYNSANDIEEEYQPYFNTLVFAQNQQHMADMKAGINDGIANRRVLANSSFWAQMGAGLFDPINLIPLPFGGASIGIVRSAFRTGAGVSLLQAGLEVSRSAIDPLQTMEEGVSNTAMAAVSGLLFGGAFSVPLNRRILAEARHNKAHIEATERAESFENLASLSNEELAAARSKPIRKQFESETTININGEVTILRQSGVGPNGPVALSPENAARLKSLTSELAVRNLDNLGKDPYAIAAGGTGPIYLSTPIRRVLSAAIPDSVKERMSRMASDSALLQNLHTMGKTLGASVYQRMVPLKGEWVKADFKLTELWGLQIGTDIKRRAGMNLTEKAVALESKFGSGQRQTYNDFLVEINRQRVFKEEPKTEVEVAARKVLDDFYDVWGQRLQETGLIGNKNKLDSDILKVDGRIADLEARLAKIESNPKFKYKKMTVASIRSQMTRATKRREGLQDSLDSIADGETNVTPANEDFFSPRYFDHATVRARREDLEKIISEWYGDNPFIYVRDKSGRIVKQRLDSNKTATDARAKATVSKILNETTEDADEFFGSGKSMHLKHRGLDIPNHLVWEFMVQNPIDTMKSYVHKTGGRYEFAKMFDGQDFDEMLEDVRLEMMEAGHSQRDINKVGRDFIHMYDRVVTSVMKTDPDRWDNKAAFVMKEAAQFNYLGSAGLSAIPDFSRIIMEHELGDVLRGLTEILSNERVRLDSKELNWAGEALEMAQGNVSIRMIDDISNNPRATTKYDMMKNAFYIANGLSPITQFAKTLDSIIRGHVIIKDSIAWKNGTISKQNKEYLLRYGISEEMALNIAAAPHQSTGNPSNPFYLPNTKDWEGGYTMPETNRKKVYGETKSYTKDGEYLPVVVRKNQILFDPDFIKDSFASKPWTKGSTPMAEDAFVTPQDYANFMLNKEILRSEGFDMGHADLTAHNLFYLTDGELTSLFGKEFNVSQIITDPAEVRGAFARSDYPDAMGLHQYIKYDKLGNVTSPPKVFVDKEKAFMAYEDFRKSIDSMTPEERLADLEQYKNVEKPIGGGIGSYVHRKFVLENLDVIKTPNDFLEFILYHELTHGKLLKTQYQGPLQVKPIQGPARPETPYALGDVTIPLREIESLENYELRIDQNAMIFLKDRQVKFDKADYILNKLAYERHSEQPKVNEETLTAFRSALSSGALNTIMMGTPADKPIIVDGVAYIPMNVAGKFGMKEDARVRGYARIESGLLGLPFQFYSYALAATNKVAGSFMQGQMKNRWGGLATAIGAGYLSVMIKTPEWAWDKMEWEDRFARSFDQSGIMALYSDLFYTSMSTSIALGGPNISGGMLNPKFPPREGPMGMLDAATGVAGAGVSITTDYAEGVGQFLNGEYGEGSKQVIRSLPFARMWFWKNQMNETTNAISRF